MSSPAVKRAKNFSRENIFLLKEIEEKLLNKKIVSAATEAELLLLHFSGTSRVDFFTGQKTISSIQKKKLAAALKKRFAGIPLQHLMGTAGFWGKEFYVTPKTLI